MQPVDYWIDLGFDHHLHFTFYKDDPYAGARIKHKRLDTGADCEGFIAFTGHSWEQSFQGTIQSWEIQQMHPLTCSPSILCRSCGDHGFIREGKWVLA